MNPNESYLHLFRGETIHSESLSPTLQVAAEILIFDGSIIAQKRLWNSGEDLYIPSAQRARDKEIELQLEITRKQLREEYSKSQRSEETDGRVYFSNGELV